MSLVLLSLLELCSPTSEHTCGHQGKYIQMKMSKVFSQYLHKLTEWLNLKKYISRSGRRFWNFLKDSYILFSEVAQSCPTPCNPMDCKPSGSSIHGIFQARILELVAISFSRYYLEDSRNNQGSKTGILFWENEDYSFIFQIAVQIVSSI